MTLELSSALTEALEGFRLQWQEQRRLRYAIYAAGFLLGLSLILSLSERNHARQQQLQQQVQRLAQLETLREETHWAGSRERLAQQWGRALDATARQPTEGLIQAGLRDWLVERLALEGLNALDMAVRVDRPVVPEGLTDVLPEDLRVARAEFGFTFRGPQLMLLLEQLALHPEWLWVERLQLYHDRQPRVVLTVAALYRLGEPR